MELIAIVNDIDVVIDFNFDIVIDRDWPIFQACFVPETAVGWCTATCRTRRCGPDRCVPASCWAAGEVRPDCIPGWRSGDIPPRPLCSSTCEAGEQGLQVRITFHFKQKPLCNCLLGSTFVLSILTIFDSHF